MAAGGFPLIAFVEKTFPDGNTGQVPVHAWADYWGVWLDYDYQNIVTDTTPFTKVNSEDTSNYYLKPKSVSIRKISVEKKSLNELDGVEIELFVEWDIKETGSDCWWNSSNYVIRTEGTIPIYNIDENSNRDDDRCMKERSASLGVPTTGTYVDFKGYLDQKKLTDMYYQLDIALLPNKPSVKLFSKGLEIGDVTSPMKLFEYFAFGLPIISSDLPVLREILNGKNSILVTFGNIKNWAEAIE